MLPRKMELPERRASEERLLKTVNQVIAFRVWQDSGLLLKFFSKMASLVGKRLKEFASSVLTSSSQGVPAGLTVVESDIMQSIGMFGRVVSRNQLVFGRHYSQIIAALAGELSLKHPNQDRSGTPVSGDL